MMESDTKVILGLAMLGLLAAVQNYEAERAAEDPAAVRAATRKREAAIREAAERGLSRRAIGDLTGMSHTRVIQILEGQERRDATVAELRELDGEALADRLLALAYSNSLSREEMAQATGRSVEEVNQLISSHAEALAQRRHEKALAMVKRHMPEGWTPEQ
jgi:transcriptional regulator with XRE-family HTH domain